MMKLTPNKKVTFDPFLHCYQCGGTMLIGVTSLLSKHNLSAAYGDIDPDVLAAAAARGSAVHKAIENYNNGDSVVFSDTLYKGRVVLTAKELEDNLSAYKDLGVNAIASEFLISDNKLVASSIDIVEGTEQDGVVDLLDIKTTSEVHHKALSWQLACYAYLLEKQCRGKVKVRNCFCIHIRKGVAKRIAVTPVSADKVEALFKAESEGRIYSEDETKATDLVPSQHLTQFVQYDTRIAELKDAIKELEGKQSLLKEEIYARMLAENISELPVEGGVIKLSRPSQRSGVDSAKLREEYPEIFKRCLKVSEIKGSLTFKPNK